MIWQACMENESHISNTFIHKINLYAFTCICHVISCRLQNELSLFVSVVLNIINEKTEIIHNLLSAQLICSKRNAFDRQMSNDCMVTVGSLNADILSYNADNLSITLKLWGKLDENVSWVNTFPSHSPISIHFTRQNIAYRCVNACDSTDAFNAHSVISRKRLPQTCDNTDTVRSAPVLRKLSISAGLSSVHDVFLCQLWSVSIFEYIGPTQLFSSCSKNSIFAADEHNTENVRSGFHYRYHLQGQFQD